MVSQTEESGLCCAQHTVHLPLLPLFDHQHTKEFPIIFLNDVLVECLRSIKPCYYSNTITCKNSLWESKFSRQSLRNWDKTLNALWAGTRCEDGGRGGVQSSALLRPAPYKGRRVRWGSVRPHLWAQSRAANIPHKPDIYFCNTFLQTSDLFSDFDSSVRAGTTLQWLGNNKFVLFIGTEYGENSVPVILFWILFWWFDLCHCMYCVINTGKHKRLDSHRV